MADLNRKVFAKHSFEEHDELAMAHYNRFVNYYKMHPYRRRDILYIFFDAFEFDKDRFCHSYTKIIKPDNSRLSQYYKSERPMMDNICDCVLEMYDKALIAKLKKMADDDQKYRANPPADWAKQNALDAVNVALAMEIYQKYGFPDRRLVGVEHEDVFFFVIQHSNLSLMEKFLPDVQRATMQGTLSTKLYPYLQDRILMLKGLPQEFGTQSVFNTKTQRNELYKTIKLEQVNLNRIKYNLKPL